LRPGRAAPSPVETGSTGPWDKAAIAAEISDEMKKQPIPKTRMAEMMRTSRAELDRLLDPDSGGATLETSMRAARAIGRELRLGLV
jgi:hypothetical protein